MLLIFAILLISSSTWARLSPWVRPSPLSSQVNQAPTFLDQKRDHYISLENTLWAVISGGLEQRYVLEQVHSGHNTFLRESFLEKSSPLSTFDPDQRILHDAIKQINESLGITLDNYIIGHTRRYYNERDLLAVATHNKNLTYSFDKIFDVTGTGEFYKTIRNVSAILV